MFRDLVSLVSSRRAALAVGSVALLAASSPVTAQSAERRGGSTHQSMRPQSVVQVVVDDMDTGEKLGAGKCLEWGLCNRVVPADRLMDETLAWAQVLAQRAPLSLRYAKEAVGRACQADLDQTISDEAALQAICIRSEDAAEGTQAFLEKREPVWKGR